ncbi:MAG: Spy/CpxP family protein refolding chaperone [Proteobacteria bacterium]|nr:Spy/CpxP family protein refolding chaperone [Pseudomonadota bacterium]
MSDRQLELATDARKGRGMLSPQSRSPYEDGTDMPSDFTELCVDMVTEASTYWVALKSSLEFTLQQLEIWAEIEDALRSTERDDRDACPATSLVSQEADASQRARIERLQVSLAQARRLRLDASIRRLAATLSPDQRHRLSHRPPPSP